MREGFHNKLKTLINEYILDGYKLIKNFPQEERYELSSQGRRSLVSIMLNYVEGYGRTKKKVLLNFYETSFGSLKESIYVFYLSYRLNFITQKQYLDIYNKKEEISKMIWKTIEGIKTDIKNDNDEK